MMKPDPDAEHMSFSSEPVSNSADTLVSANSGIQIFLYRKWGMYKVSPLYRCGFSEAELKRQAKWLSQQLKMKMTKNAFECVEIQVQCNLLPHFLKLGAVNPLQILVQKKQMNKTLDIYEGIFINCLKTDPSSTTSFKHFPTLICRGNPSSIFQINLLLRKLFDCRITPSHLTDTTFHWLFTIIFLHIDSTTQEDEQLTLTLEPANFESIDLQLSSKFVRNIWATIHKGGLQINEADVLEFKDLLWEVMYGLYAIRFENFLFSKIQVKDTILLRNGTIKTKNDVRMTDYLRFMHSQNSMNYQA